MTADEFSCRMLGELRREFSLNAYFAVSKAACVIGKLRACRRVENYPGTLNHALDRAMIRLLNSSEFRSAVCSCGKIISYAWFALNRLLRVQLEVLSSFRKSALLFLVSISSVILKS